jgi:glycosyltransferase involved in cell wall biosynthesis
MTTLPRICIVLPNIYPVLSHSRAIELVGGAEIQHTVAATSLAKAGYDTSVVTLDFGQPDWLECEAVKVFKSHMPGGGIPVLRFLYPRLVKTWRAMQRADADIYLQPCAGYLTGVVSAFCRMYGRKSVFVGASDTDFIPDKLRLSGRRDKSFFYWGVRNAHGVIVQTTKQKRLCRENYGRDATVIPNGYELRQPRPANRRDYVLWVGSIRDVKRPDRLIQIARALPEYKFRMIGGPTGDGPEPQAYYRKVKAEAQTVRNLEFFGFLPYDEAEPHFDHASVFLNTSDVEGFPNTFLQSWARGIPTVSMFDPQLTEPDVYCKAATIDNAVASIRELIENPGIWNGYAIRCKSYFQKHHSVAANVDRYSAFFSELAGE